MIEHLQCGCREDEKNSQRSTGKSTSNGEFTGEKYRVFLAVRAAMHDRVHARVSSIFLTNNVRVSQWNAVDAYDNYAFRPKTRRNWYKVSFALPLLSRFWKVADLFLPQLSLHHLWIMGISGGLQYTCYVWIIAWILCNNPSFYKKKKFLLKELKHCINIKILLIKSFYKI